MGKESITIEGRQIGPGHRPYVIAELSANHNGRIEKALETIEVAAQCGADALKLQTYTPDTMTIDCDGDDFQVHGGLWDGYKLYDLYRWAHTPFEWHEALFKKARESGITVFSTPFDTTAVDLLEELGTPAYKIASFEIVDLPLIKRVAETGKAMIISTGMATLEEIDEAVVTATRHGSGELILLHCISAYPAPAHQANLMTLQDLSRRFNVITGLSDHTEGLAVSIAAVALGASVIEKHFILDRNDKGPDSEFSIEPQELERLVFETGVAHEAIGSPSYERRAAEAGSMKFRRSIYFVNDVQQGEEITEDQIRIIRPGYGLAPKYYNKLIGAKAVRTIKRGTAANWELVETNE